MTTVMRNQPTPVAQPISAQRNTEETLEEYMKGLVESDISKEDFEEKLNELSEQRRINVRQIA
jgi:hypothetical protein